MLIYSHKLRYFADFCLANKHQNSVCDPLLPTRRPGDQHHRRRAALTPGALFPRCRVLLGKALPPLSGRSCIISDSLSLATAWAIAALEVPPRLGRVAPNLVSLVLLCTLVSVPAWSAEDNPFRVRRAGTRLQDGLYLLSANLSLNLTRGPREALQNGLPLYLTIEMEVYQQKGWWPDERVATVTQRYRLEYHDLSRRYLVTNLNTGVVEGFFELDAALGHIGQLTDFPLLDSVLVRGESRFQGYIQLSLDLDELPLPLLLRVYFSPDWRLASDKHQWLLK